MEAEARPRAPRSRDGEAPGQGSPGRPPVRTGQRDAFRGRNPGRQIPAGDTARPLTESAAPIGTRVHSQRTTTPPPAAPRSPGRPWTDPGGGTSRARARATSPSLGAMGTRVPQSLLLLLLFLPTLPPRGASAGSLHSPGECWLSYWTLVTIPSSAFAPRNRVPSLGAGQGRWGEQPSGPQGPAGTRGASCGAGRSR